MTIDKLDSDDLKNILQDIYDDGYMVEMKEIKKGQKTITICNVGGADLYSLPIDYVSIKESLKEVVDRIKEAGVLVKIEIERGFVNTSRDNNVSPYDTLKFDEVPDTIDLVYKPLKTDGMNIGPDSQNYMKKMLYGDTDQYVVCWIRLIIEQTTFTKIKKFFDFK